MYDYPEFLEDWELNRALARLGIESGVPVTAQQFRAMLDGSLGAMPYQAPPPPLPRQD